MSLTQMKQMLQQQMKQIVDKMIQQKAAQFQQWHQSFVQQLNEIKSTMHAAAGQQTSAEPGIAKRQHKWTQALFGARRSIGRRRFFARVFGRNRTLQLFRSVTSNHDFSARAARLATPRPVRHLDTKAARNSHNFWAVAVAAEWPTQHPSRSSNANDTKQCTERQPRPPIQATSFKLTIVTLVDESSTSSEKLTMTCRRADDEFRRNLCEPSTISYEIRRIVGEPSADHNELLTKRCHQKPHKGYQYLTPKLCLTSIPSGARVAA